MAVRHGYGKIAGADALVFAYDTGDTRNSYKGEPTVNYVPGTYGYSLYAYASGPVDTVVLNEKNQSTTVKRYTITNAINTARAAIFPSGLTTGVAYTFSFKWRYNGSTTASPSVGINASKGNPEGGANNNSFTSQIGNTVNIGNGWYLSTYTFIFSSVPTGKCMLTFGIITGSNAGYVGETFDIYEAQFEIKNHRTQYSNGTRSSTQGLLDLTGNSTINLANVSFDSNAQIVFDGTDDVITVPMDNLRPTSAITQEVVVYIDNNTTQVWIGSQYGTGSNNSYALWLNGTNSLAAGVNIAGSFNYQLQSYTITLNKHYHFVHTYDGTTQRIYVNGVEVRQWATSGNITYNTNNTFLAIGNDWNGSGYNTGASLATHGKQDITKIYNRALTAAEVQNNFNNYKTRFDI